MALDQETKSKIVYHLGYAGKVLLPNSTHYNKIVNDRMENLDSFIEEEVESLLAQIANARTNYSATQTKGNVTRIGDIELDPSYTRSNARAEYKRLLKELSCLLDLSIVCNNEGSIKVFGP